MECAGILGNFINGVFKKVKTITFRLNLLTCSNIYIF